MADELENLQECMWRGISFPVSSIGENIQQQLVQHKRVDRDGAFIEATGRMPITYTLVVPLFNTISRGAQENWTDLYPGTFLRLRAAIKDDRTSGIFNHPLFGEILCKPQGFESPLNAQQRGGQIANITLIETVETSSTEVATQKLQNNAKNLAISLDAQLSELSPPPAGYDPSKEGEDFTSVIDKIQAVSDTVALQNDRIISLVGSTIRKTQQLARLVTRNISVSETNADGTKTIVGQLGSGKSRIEQTAINLTSELYKVRSSLLNNASQEQSVYTTNKDYRMVGLAALLNNTPLEIRTLNPNLNVFIPEKTLVRYYIKNA